MTLDIGTAVSEGFSRTFAKNGLLLAGVFVAVGLLSLVLTHTLVVAVTETTLEFFQGLSPAELELSQAEYDELLAELETGVEDVREGFPLALGLPASVAAGGLLVTALAAEAASIVAVRVFATDETDAVPRKLATDNVLLATLNGFIGGIVVWGLILVGLALFVLPGIFLAVAFFFLRQEIALNDRNFVQAMADSWRTTKGTRFEVFALGLVVVVVSLVEPAAGFVVGLASDLASQLASVVVGGFLTVFGAAAVTRGYVQLSPDEEPPAEEEPYSKALGPEDIPE